MSSQVSIFDVAKAGGVSICTVSRVINGKTSGVRISPTTRQRILAIARQMGYQADPIARDVALGKGAPARPAVATPAVISNEKAQMTAAETKRRQIRVILSATSSAEVLGLIPDIESTLESAGYQLATIIVPAESTAAHERITRLFGDGLAGILCCPSLYPTVSEMASGKCPAIVLWQGAGKAMLNSVSSGQLAVGSPGVEQPEPAPALPPKPTPVAPIATPKPVIVVPVPIIVTEPPPVIETLVEPVSPTQSQVPEPPVSGPVVEPQAMDSTPTPVVEPQPDIPEEQLTPVSEPVTTPTDGTEAVPPADNSLEGEDQPAASLPNQPPDPVVIEPMPVEPSTPVFDPPSDVPRPEDPVPPPQAQEPATPVSVPEVETQPADTTPTPASEPEPVIPVELAIPVSVPAVESLPPVIPAPVAAPEPTPPQPEPSPVPTPEVMETTVTTPDPNVIAEATPEIVPVLETSTVEETADGTEAVPP